MEIISLGEARAAGLKKYFTGKPCVRGHVSERNVSTRGCVECVALASAEYFAKHRDELKERAKIYRKENAEHLDRKAAEWRERNKEKLKATAADYYLKNKEKILARTAAYQKANRDKVNAWSAKSKKKHAAKVSKSVGAYMKSRSEVDHVYAMRRRVRTLVSMAFVKKGYKKGSKTEQIIGCSFEYLFEHIEKQFTKGMTWENRHLWHVDHIVPLCTATTEDEVVKLNHFTNLRPIWGTENLKKNGKELFLI